MGSSSGHLLHIGSQVYFQDPQIKGVGLGVRISDELPAIWLNALKPGVRALEPGEQSHPANVTSLITMRGPHCQPHLGFYSCFYLGHLCFTPRLPAHAWKVGWSASSPTTLEGLSPCPSF